MNLRSILAAFLAMSCVVGVVQVDGDDDGTSTWPRRPRRSGPSAPSMSLTFSGNVDGSERIIIDRNGARWQNVHWATARSPVRLNGVSWHPRTAPYLANTGDTVFLSKAVDFSTARLAGAWRGRDTVAIVPAKDSVTIRIADNPNGADLYEFSVLFDKVRPSADLVIHATIEGSDEVVITAAGATWKQKHWGWPRGTVRFNAIPWTPKNNARLANSGTTRYLPPDVDLGSARLVRVSGRDLAAIETADDRLIVRFADTPVGASDYELIIRFGPE